MMMAVAETQMAITMTLVTIVMLRPTSGPCHYARGAYGPRAHPDLDGVRSGVYEGSAGDHVVIVSIVIKRRGIFRSCVRERPITSSSSQHHPTWRRPL